MDDGHDPPNARAPEPADVARVARALNAVGARYVLIGGSAVIAHGGSRFTKDVDLLVDDDPANVARVTKDTYRPQDRIDRRLLSGLIDSAG